MKSIKNKLFFFLMLAISILLFLLRVTGMAAHIALSVVGIVILVAFAVMNKKEWKKPALEILLRVLFAVAVITGIVILKGAGVADVVNTFGNHSMSPSKDTCDKWLAELNAQLAAME